MIVGIEGTVERRDPTFVHLNVNGIIYEVQVSINTSNMITEKREALYCSMIMDETIENSGLSSDSEAWW